MDKEKFKEHLDEATKKLVEFTKTHCFNEFPQSYKYIITPNSRTVENNEVHLTKEEIEILKKWNKFEDKLLTADEVVELFHHHNKVPLWIDMTVYESKFNLTVINLNHSRRLRGEKDLMHQGLHPFHIQVAMPPNKIGVETNEKFDINWKKKLDENENK